MKKNILLTLGLVTVALLSKAQDFPTPSAYYNFNTDWFINDNKTDKDTGTKLLDDSGNTLDAVWYNYNAEFPALYSGFKSDEGKWNGAAFLGGFKSVCNDDPSFPGDNSPAAARDALYFAGNADSRGWNVIDTSNIWQGVRKKFTISYWWKSDRKLTSNGSTNACPPDEIPDWAEKETHFDGGAFNGIDVISYYNYLKLGWRNGSDGVDVSHQTDFFGFDGDGNTFGNEEWVHITITFDGSTVDGDGNPTGELTLYLNGELAVDWEGKSSNPNPILTGQTQFDAVTFDEAIVSTTRGAVLFGATNGASPSGTNSGGEFWGEVPEYDGKYGYVEDHYRMGWPARGYLDEFAYWKDVALTQEQIKAIMETEISELITSIGDKPQNNNLNVYPSPSNGNITVDIDNNIGGKLIVINMVGSTVYDKVVESGTKSIDLNLSLTPGMYMVKYDSGNEYNISRIIIE